MKKSLLFVILLAFCAGLLAQQPTTKQKQHKEPPRIEEMVSNLSPIQKKRLETITTTSRKKMNELRAELENVRTQIRSILDQEGDHSDQLFPLFEREGELKTEISKEMYRTRQAIDKVLTKDQLQELQTSLKADRSTHKGNRKSRRH